MTSPTVSVVITTYNRPDRLPKVLETVHQQTFQDFEIIVVDGANSDKNKRIVAKYKILDYRIRYLRVKEEAVKYVSWRGVQHARNVGCKQARGKYIAMLDDDDLWAKNKLEKQVKIFEEDKTDKVGLVLCYNKIISGKSEVIDKTKISPNYRDLLKSFNLSSTSTYLIRKYLLEKIGWWDESLRGMHEYDIALKLTKLDYKIVTIDEPLMIRYRTANMERRYYYIKIAEVLDLWKNYGKDFIPYIGIKGFLFNSFKAVCLFGIFLIGYGIKEKVWEIIYPFKVWYEQGEL